MVAIAGVAARCVENGIVGGAVAGSGVGNGEVGSTVRVTMLAAGRLVDRTVASFCPESHGALQLVRRKTQSVTNSALSLVATPHLID